MRSGFWTLAEDDAAGAAWTVATPLHQLTSVGFALFYFSKSQAPRSVTATYRDPGGAFV